MKRFYPPTGLSRYSNGFFTGGGCQLTTRHNATTCHNDNDIGTFFTLRIFLYLWKSHNGRHDGHRVTACTLVYCEPQRAWISLFKTAVERPHCQTTCTRPTTYSRFRVISLQKYSRHCKCFDTANTASLSVSQTNYDNESSGICVIC